MPVKIITDSTAYIDRRLLKELDITEVSMTVNFEEHSCLETELANEEFYQRIAKMAKLPTSSQPSPLTFYQAFLEKVEQGYDVLSVLLSSNLSGTYFSAVQGRDMVLQKYPEANIEIIDTRTTVMAMGLVALSLARFVQEGSTLPETVAKAHDLLSRSKIFFIPKTLDHLKKGGRIGEAAALLGSLLQITPILTVKGPVTVFEKVRTFEKAVKRMLAVYEEDANTKGIEAVAVHHINSLEEGQRLVEQVQKITDLEVPLRPIGPVLGIHVGPGTLGLAYTTK
ncbi:MAG: DegV family protein [Clostridia bacterium]|nr:DegV family protein [Clostridia bacterium]